MLQRVEKQAQFLLEPHNGHTKITASQWEQLQLHQGSCRNQSKRRCIGLWAIPGEALEARRPRGSLGVSALR
jgi:hypothetical protein